MKLNKRNRILILGFMFLLLVLVRAFEESLFYDPFVHYFKFDYLKSEFPIFDMGALLFGLIVRYSINTIISLIIIYTAYLNRGALLFAIKLYAFAFVVIFLFYFMHLRMEFSNGYLFPFYLRRILIHPVLLLILLPTFYFYRKTKAKV